MVDAPAAADAWFLIVSLTLIVPPMPTVDVVVLMAVTIRSGSVICKVVDEARQLAEDFGIPVEFVQGSMIPEGHERLFRHLGDFAHLETDAASAYDDLQLEPDDFDLIFTFPWPGEEPFAEKLFDRCAADGALLLSYHGINDLRLQRRVRR